MINQHRRQLTPAEFDAVLLSSGIDPTQVDSSEELPEGTYNTVYRLRLVDGTGLVLKVAPNPDGPTLTYERGILATEALFYTAAAGTGQVPVPRVRHADYSRTVVNSDFLVMTECPGQSWQHLKDRIAGDDQTRLRRDLGHLVATLHALTGPGFGYPQQSVARLTDSWRAAFLSMTDAVFSDARRHRVTLPRPVSEINDLVLANAAVLDQVTVPVMVHFDLWLGNILLDRTEQRLRISGLVDGERAFWGDPIADFASLALFGDLTQDEPFLGGYRAAGGAVTFDRGTRLRMSLYCTYLYVIMLVESVVRSSSRLDQRRTFMLVGPHLTAQVAALAEATR